MANNQETIKQVDKLDIKFDIKKWMQTIFQTIDANRSDTPGNPSIVGNSSADTGSGESTESRLNCFYRLCGFPATRDESMLPVTTDKKSLAQNGTLNYFGPSDVSLSEIAIKKFHGREYSLHTPITSENMIQMLQDPLPIVSSMSPRKTDIFPLLVDASIPVYPLKKRTSPLFFSGDYLLPGNPQARLPRSFLESVIYIRTQQFRQEVEQRSQATLDALKDFIIQASSGISEEQAAADLEAFKDTINNSQFTKLEIDIINKLVVGIRNAAADYKRIYNRCQALSREVVFTPAPITNPNEKSGTIKLNVEPAPGADVPPIDARIAQLRLKLEEITSLLNVMPTARIKEADKTYRITNNLNVTNITDDIFVSEFSEILSYERESYEKELQEVEELKAIKIREFESIRQAIQIFTGEGLGLSIFDVLCVFLALFTVDLETLIGLLNNDAQQRLKSSKFFSFQSDVSGNNIRRDAIFSEQSRVGVLESALNGNSVSVASALESVQEKVVENFKLAQAFFIEAGKSGQNRE